MITWNLQEINKELYYVSEKKYLNSNCFLVLFETLGAVFLLYCIL